MKTETDIYNDIIDVLTELNEAGGQRFNERLLTEPIKDRLGENYTDEDIRILAEELSRKK